MKDALPQFHSNLLYNVIVNCCLYIFKNEALVTGMETFIFGVHTIESTQKSLSLPIFQLCEGWTQTLCLPPGSGLARE